jgi:Cdc6-like AAA superfamily ATPase
MAAVPSFRINDTPLDLLSDHFTGREEEMGQILASLEVAHEDMPTRCLLHGERGVGKTQLALMLAKSTFAQGRYHSIFWIQATTIDELRQDFSTLLQSIDHPGGSHPEEGTRLAETRRWLEDFTHGRWLLIFDNVSHRSLPFLREHLPRKNSAGNILFTTRMESIASALTHVSGEQHSAYKLRTLYISGTAVLLLRHLSNGTIDADGSQIREIVDCVDRLPLAIERVAACLKQAKTTLAELLAMFKRNRTRIKVHFLHDDFYCLRELIWSHR